MTGKTDAKMLAIGGGDEMLTDVPFKPISLVLMSLISLHYCWAVICSLNVGLD